MHACGMLNRFRSTDASVRTEQERDDGKGWNGEWICVLPFYGLIMLRHLCNTNCSSSVAVVPWAWMTSLLHVHRRCCRCIRHTCALCLSVLHKSQLNCFVIFISSRGLIGPVYLLTSAATFISLVFVVARWKRANFIAAKTALQIAGHNFVERVTCFFIVKRHTHTPQDKCRWWKRISYFPIAALYNSTVNVNNIVYTRYCCVLLATHRWQFYG